MRYMMKLNRCKINYRLAHALLKTYLLAFAVFDAGGR